MVKNLMLYGQSGFLSCYTQNLTEFMQGLEDSAVVLMEDGVNGIMKPVGTEMTEGHAPYHKLIQKNIPIYCLLEDVESRGGTTDNLISGIKAITYADLIDHIDGADRVISWL